MLKISIAMAVYNGSKFIEKQLDSILRQIRLPDEVVIVDDCSTDDTPVIIQKYIADNNLQNWKLYLNDTNLGYKRNFYKAISMTSGDIIFTCDQDDIWCDDKIESIAGLFAKYDHVMAVSTAFTLIDGDGYPIEKSSHGNYGLINSPIVTPLQKINLKTIIHSNISPGCTSAFRKKTADLFIAVSDNEMPHDYEINLIAAALGGLYFYNIPLIKYRIHDNNTLGLEGKSQTRIDIAKEKQAAAAVIMKINSDDRIYKMYSKRLSALENARVSRILKLYLNPLYRKFLTFRERIGDLIYILRSRE